MASSSKRLNKMIRYLNLLNVYGKKKKTTNRMASSCDSIIYNDVTTSSSKSIAI